MINQGDSKRMLLKQIKKAFNRHLEACQRYDMASGIVGKIAATSINTRSVPDGRGYNKLVQCLGSNGPTCNLS